MDKKPDSRADSPQAVFTCPPVTASSDVIKLGHGSGGKMTARLIESVFMPSLSNPTLAKLEDAGVVTAGGARIAVTTDSYVVSPIFFPGGDIGKLAVFGTVNDLAMMGAKPLYVTAAFILEEGLPLDELRAVVASFEAAAKLAQVTLVSADTKVVNKGCGDKIFITTSGIGLVTHTLAISSSAVKPGDAVIVSGPLGRHGMAIMCARGNFAFESDLSSDCAPLHYIVEALIDAKIRISCMRDLTRGGLASALNEIAESSGLGFEIQESAIPADVAVRASCEVLGLDELYVACEGTMVAIVHPEDAEKAAAIMRQFPQGAQAAVIGNAQADPKRVVLRSKIGGSRIVDRLSGEQLPRIC